MGMCAAGDQSICYSTYIAIYTAIFVYFYFLWRSGGRRGRRVEQGATFYLLILLSFLLHGRFSAHPIRTFFGTAYPVAKRPSLFFKRGRSSTLLNLLCPQVGQTNPSYLFRTLAAFYKTTRKKGGRFSTGRTLLGVSYIAIYTAIFI